MKKPILLDSFAGRDFATIAADPPWKYRDKVHAARVRGVKEIGYGRRQGWESWGNEIVEEENR